MRTFLNIEINYNMLNLSSHILEYVVFRRSFRNLSVHQNCSVSSSGRSLFFIVSCSILDAHVICWYLVYWPCTSTPNKTEQRSLWNRTRQCTFRKADVCINVSLLQTPFCLCHMENRFRVRVRNRSACSYQTQAHRCQYFLPWERTNPWAWRYV